MKSLWQQVRQKNCASLAICGLAKNAGKTVTLNYLVNAGVRDGVRLGVTSLGRDGEMWDILSNRRKPSIQVRPGMLLATAERTLPAATARLAPVRPTGIGTALGQVVIVRAETAGTVELAGPAKIGQMIALIGILQRMGARLVLVDGAMDRQSLAAPRVAEAFIMATGAVLSDSITEVATLSRIRVQQFALPAASRTLKELHSPGHVVVIAEEGRKRYPSAVVRAGGEDFWRSLGRKISCVVFGGALLAPTLEALLSSGIASEDITLVVRDATCLFIEAEQVDRFFERKGRIEVLDPMQLLAVTANPTSPESSDFDSKDFFLAMRRALPGIPVYDLVQGYGPECSF